MTDQQHTNIYLTTAAEGTIYRNQIEAIMKKRGYPRRLSRLVLAQIGTNAHQFGQWLRNEAQPNIGQAQKLAQVLKIETAQLQEGVKFE